MADPNHIVDLVGSGFAGTVAGGFFMWLARMQRFRVGEHIRSEKEMESYRQELRTDLEAARIALDAVQKDRISLLEKTALERIRLEDRVATLEREKLDCQGRIAEMAERIREMESDLGALRRMVGVRGIHE